MRWGILGPGRIAHNFAEAMKVVEGSCVHAVHSHDASRAQNFAQRFGIQHTYTDIEQFLADELIEAVYIAYPHPMHAKAIEACLIAGKHVLCEKPLTTCKADAQELTLLAQESRVFLMEALWTRFLPVWQKVREWLSEGRIGKLTAIESSMGFKADLDHNNRLFNPELGGGAIWDLGVYPISMTEFVLGEQPNSIEAEYQLADTGVEADARVIFGYENNLQSRFRCSFYEQLENELRIEGEQGSIIIEAPFWGSERARLEFNNGQTETFDAPHQVNGFEYQIRSSVQCIEEGLLENSQISWASTLAAQGLMDNLLAKYIRTP